MKGENKLGYSKLRPYVYLTPSIIPIIVLSFLPIAYTVYIAFTNYNLNNLENYKVIGLANFKDVLTGPFSKVFLPVFLWNVFFALVSTLGCFLIGLLFALLLNNEHMKESKIYKAILILPWALPATIAVLTWKGLLNQSYGGINMLFKALGLGGNIPWLTDPTWARVGLIIMNFWLGFPYMMNVALGALTSISDTYYEAAEIDGAKWWHKFRYITLPSIASTCLPLLITSFAFNFNNFGSAFLVTDGGPARIGQQYAGYTDILISSAYKLSMRNNRYDISAALSVLIFIVVGTLSFIQLKKTNAFKEE